MSGSCNACSKNYGFFCKEVGCPNCGFSFCTKCLKKTIAVPRCGNAERKVCLSCFEKLSIQKLQQSSVEQQQQQINAIPSKVASNDSVLDAPIPDEELLPDVDEEIQRRLQVIKQPINDLDKNTSDQGMAERLANLKGVPHKEYDHRELLNAVDKRTDTEKANDLVEQFMKEVDLDVAVQDSYEDPIKSIERRLAALKGISNEQNDQIGSTDENPVDEESLAKKIVIKYLDEAKLPDSELTAEEKEFVNSIKPEKDTEELPWCTICNEDATIRCIGCDGDLFCKACFNEIHANDEEYREHQTKKFIPKETQPQ